MGFRVPRIRLGFDEGRVIHLQGLAFVCLPPCESAQLLSVLLLRARAERAHFGEDRWDGDTRTVP